MAYAVSSGTRALIESTFPGQRHLGGWLGWAVRVATIVLPLLTILVAFTGWFDTMTRRSGHLVFAIPLIFLLYPWRPGKTRLGIGDLGLAAAAVAAFGWIIVERERIMWRLVYVDPISWADMIFGITAIVLVLEATRRTLGWTLVILALAFLGYALAGPAMPGIFEHKGVPFPLLVEHLYLVPEGLFNMVTGVMATYLLVFLTFGSLLRMGGGERIFTDLTMTAAGRWTGGPAKAAVMGSTIMGMISGSTIANVVTTGTITIPLMKRNGFKPHEAAAIETAASTGGALMPPVMGAGVFIMAEITGIPLLTILKYSLLPALLYFFSIYTYVHVKARKGGMARLEVTAGGPALWMSLARGLHLLAPLGLMIYMLVRDYSAFYAASSAVVALWLVSYLRAETRMTPRRVLLALEATTRGALILSATTAIAAVIVGVIGVTGLMLKATSAMVALAGGSLLIGIGIIALISLVLGMGLPITSSYIIISTLGAPALTELGLPLLGAHLLVFWFAQSATVTPPICMSAFVAAQIAGARPMRTGFEALRVAKALYFVPLMFAYTSILSGDWPAMLFDAGAGLLVLMMVTIVAEGFHMGRIGLAGRAMAAAAGACFAIATFSLGVVYTVAWLVAGAGLIGALSAHQLFRGGDHVARESKVTL
jgi:TRAP transporter 4TM/12TM fusion protein